MRFSNKRSLANTLVNTVRVIIKTSVKRGLLWLLVIAAASVYATDEQGFSRAVYAQKVIANGDIQQFNELQREGLELDQDIDGDGTLLIIAIRHGNKELVEYLLALGADVNQESQQDGTPLIVAVQSANNELVKYLVSQGADVNQASIRDGNPIINAAQTNNLSMVEYLLAQGANIDDVVEHDETALITASRAGHFRIVKFLVEQGADVNLAVEATTLTGSELRTPLSGAKTRAIRDYLLAQGATS